MSMNVAGGLERRQADLAQIKKDMTPTKGEPMELDNGKARLVMNARAHRHDAQLERALELFHTDRAAYDRLPRQLQSEAGVYVDLRDHYRAAVEAGAIPDDRSAA